MGSRQGGLKNTDSLDSAAQAVGLKVYLVGPIPKGDQARIGRPLGKDDESGQADAWVDWKAGYKEALSGIQGIEFLDADKWKDESNPLIVFGHDSAMVKSCDIVVVNAGSKLGAGSAQEMLIAKYFSKPVVTILPKGTHHRKANVVFGGKLVPDWIHPFIFSTSDSVVGSLGEAYKWISEYQNDPKSKPIKGISVIDSAIEAYTKAAE